MIKFNEVTWYSRIATIIICLGIFPAIVFIIGMKYEQVQEVDDSIAQIATSSMSGTSSTPSQMEDGATSDATPASGDTRVYTNKVGWHFQYPSEWKITPSADGLGVIVEPNILVTADMGAAKKDSTVFTLSFATQKKSDFKEVGTKIGQIKFDQKQNALIDTSGANDRCLPVNSKLGVNAGISTFLYSGSTMSTPSYMTSAIITNKDYLIIANMSSYGPVENDTVETDLENGLRMIYSSFGLGGDTTSVTPECTQLSSAV